MASTFERGLEVPFYGRRKPRGTVIDPFTAYLHECVTRYSGLAGTRLLQELKEFGNGGSYTAFITDHVVKATDIIGAISDDRFLGRAGDEIVSGSHVILLDPSDYEADRQDRAHAAEFPKPPRERLRPRA